MKIIFCILYLIITLLVSFTIYQISKKDSENSTSIVTSFFIGFGWPLLIPTFILHMIFNIVYYLFTHYLRYKEK